MKASYPHRPALARLLISDDNEHHTTGDLSDGSETRAPFEADAWRDPQAQREFLDRIDTYRDEGPPPADQRMSREEIRTQFGV